MAALNELVFENFSLNDKQNTLNVRLYNGAIGFSVFPRERVPGAPSKPLLGIQLDRKGQAYAGLMRIIDTVSKGPLGTKVPMTKTEFNPQTRSRNPVWTISFEKDSDMVYWISLTDIKTNASFRFQISASQSYTVGNEPPSKADLSSLALSMLVEWLKKANMYAPMTANKPGPRGPGGGQRPAYGAPAAPVAAMPAAGGDDETMPF